MLYHVLCCSKSLQSCSTLCDPMDCRPPGSSVHGILWAIILVWVTMPFSRGSSPPRESHLCLLCLLHWQADSLPLAPLGSPTLYHNIFIFYESEVKVLVTQSSPTLLWPHGLQPIKLLCPWNSPGKTQGLNPGLLHCRQILYWLSHQSVNRIGLFYSIWFTYIFQIDRYTILASYAYFSVEHILRDPRSPILVVKFLIYLVLMSSEIASQFNLPEY